MSDSVFVSSIAIEELVFWKVNISDIHGCSFVLGMTEEGGGAGGGVRCFWCWNLRLPHGQVHSGGCLEGELGEGERF